REVAMATARIAVVDLELGRSAAAAAGFAEALRRMLALAPGEYDPLDLADLHASRSQALLATGDLEQTADGFNAAESIWREHEGGPSWPRAQARWVRMKIGRANYERLYDPDHALAELDEALDMMDNIRVMG